MATYPASGLTDAAKVPYPLGDDYIDTDGHMADMAWAIDPRLVQQHDTLDAAESANASAAAIRRRGQLVYLTSTRQYYTWLGPNETAHGVTADAEGWAPLSRLLIGQGDWNQVNDIMPTVAMRVGLNYNLSSTGSITILEKKVTMPAHPLQSGGRWKAALWATCRLHYTHGQYALRGFVNNSRVFSEAYHINAGEDPGAYSHCSPVGIAGGTYAERSSVTFKIRAEVVRSTGGNRMNVDSAPSVAEAMIWPVT
jgi:hypothetical protein